jgi:hypothetical protein
MADFTIKRNDWGVSEPFRARLKQLAVNPETGEVEHDSNGNKKYKAIDLSDAEAVRLFLKGTEGLEITTDPVTIFDEEGGGIEYQFKDAEGEEPADLGTADSYLLEIKIYKVDGVTTIPNDGFYSLEVVKDLSP